MTDSSKAATVNCGPQEIVVGQKIQFRHYKDSNGRSWMRIEDLSRPDSGVSITLAGVSDLIEGLVRVEAGMTDVA